MSIEITDGNSSAVINEKGAELKSLKLGGKELMWCSDPKYWGKSSPVLFPVIGNLRNGETVIDGSCFHIPKHGFARDNVFSVKSKTSSTVTMSFSDTENTRQCFPFAFDFSLHYTLTVDKLEILYEVANESDNSMPFCIGTHPAFACPSDGYSFSDYRLIFSEKETVSSPVMNLKSRLFQNGKRIWRLKNSNVFPLDYKLFSDDVVYFDDIVSRSVSLADPEGHGVRISWDGFSSLGVWTPADMEAPFVCLEAWCGCDDYDTDNGVFRNKKGMQTALPHETQYYVMTIEPI